VENDEKQLRCPKCGRMLGKGDYPDRPIEIKCPRCGEIIRFQRLKQQ